MHIVTSGAKYLDIDAYGGMVAYAELLQKQGKPARAASGAVLNESVTKTIRSWNAPVDTQYRPNDDDTFTLIDISNPDHFDTLVSLGRVERIIDHHPGFEAYWQQRLGNSATIEFIGAACTLVFEEWAKARLVDSMSERSARLLMAGILDNTLNFKAHVTTDRDKLAYNALTKLADVPETWAAQYFAECQNMILANIDDSLKNDSKVLLFSSFAEQLAVGQLVVWDAQEVIKKHLATIEQALADMQAKWFANIVGIAEGSSYFVCKDLAVQAWLSTILNVQFEADVAKADRLWLRKEIIKAELKATAARVVQ